MLGCGIIDEVIALAHLVLQLLAGLVGLTALSIKPRRSLEAETLLLRRQMALYKERGIELRRVDAATTYGAFSMRPPPVRRWPS
jgi:hypothetical protein